MGLLPNQAICRKYCLQSEEVSADLTFTTPPNKKQLLNTINSMCSSLGGSESSGEKSSTFTFGKRNMAAQAKFVGKVVRNLETAILHSFQEVGVDAGTSLKTEDVNLLELDSQDLSVLMAQLKSRINGCTKAEIKSLLTLCPRSWSLTKAAEYFEVSTNMISSSRR